MGKLAITMPVTALSSISWPAAVPAGLTFLRCPLAFCLLLADLLRSL